MGKPREPAYYQIVAGVFATMHGADMHALPVIEDSAAWKEEVQLHNGDRIIVERSHKLGGRREIGQGPPLAEQTAAFTRPGASKRIVWRATYGFGENDSNLSLLAIEIVDNKTYLVTRPRTCMAYNKWGRPNPFYVFFMYDNDGWRRIPITDVPPAIKTPNVLLSTVGHHQRLKKAIAPITAVETRKTNTTDFHAPWAIHYRVFGREPVTSGEDNSEKVCRDVTYKYDAKTGLILEIPRTNK